MRKQNLLEQTKIHILVIPAWFDTENLLTGIFFHEYCNALCEAAQITLLNFKVHPFRERFRKNNQRAVESEHYKYEILTVDYYNGVPGRLIKSMAGAERGRMIGAAIQAVDRYIHKNGKPDVIHLQSVYNNITPLIGLALSNHLKIPYIVTEHYTSFEKAGDRHFSPLTSFKEVSGIVHRASVRIAVSNYASAYCQKCFDAPFETVYNIIGGDFEHQSPTYLSTVPVPFQFLCIGSLSERKGQVHLVEAFARFSRDVPSSTLVLVGKGSEQEKLEHLIRQHDLSDKVRIINFLEPDQFVRLIDASSVIVSASQSELFGLTIVEGFFRGRPALATFSGGPEELIDDSNGLLCEFADVTGMYRNMRTIYEGYSEYNQLKIREDAVEKFSAHAIVPQMMRIYSNLASAKDTKQASGVIK